MRSVGECSRFNRFRRLATAIVRVYPPGPPINRELVSLIALCANIDDLRIQLAHTVNEILMCQQLLGEVGSNVGRDNEFTKQVNEFIHKLNARMDQAIAMAGLKVSHHEVGKIYDLK